MFRNNLVFFIVLVCSVVGLAVNAVQSVTLGWDPSSDPNAAGYNIYYGTESRKYTEKVSAGNGTTVTINGLIEGTTYYFAATTFDLFDQESGFSEEVPYEVPGTPATPVVTNNYVAGQNVRLSASATGTGELSYQWQLDSTDIPSATNALLTLSDLATNQAGTYSVTISDAAGISTNVAVYLAVYFTASATLAQPAFAEGLYSFNVSGVPGFEYIVQASSDLSDWISVQTNIAPFNFTDPDAQQFSQRFYRSIAACNFAATTNTSNSNETAAPAPPATLTGAAHTQGTYSFTVAGEPGYEYIVQASTDLVNWVPVQTNLAPFQFADSDAGQFEQRFFRALSAFRFSASINASATQSEIPAPTRPFRPGIKDSQFHFQLTY